MNKIIELGKTAIHICKEKKVCSEQNKKKTYQYVFESQLFTKSW